MEYETPYVDNRGRNRRFITEDLCGLHETYRRVYGGNTYKMGAIVEMAGVPAQEMEVVAKGDKGVRQLALVYATALRRFGKDDSRTKGAYKALADAWIRKGIREDEISEARKGVR